MFRVVARRSKFRVVARRSKFYVSIAPPLKHPYLKPTPDNDMQADTLPWMYYGHPMVDDEELGLRLPNHLKEEYAGILAKTCTVSPVGDAILKFLWDTSPTDAQQVKVLILASVGCSSQEETIASFYDEVLGVCCPNGLVSRNRETISVIHRLLRSKAERISDLLSRESRSLTSRYATTSHPSPAFRFFVKLQSGTEEPGDLLRRYFDWQPWLQPVNHMGLAFTEKNWVTLGLFREVLDAVFGRHMVDDNNPESPLSVFLDRKCRKMAKDDQPLNGDFYILLTVGELLRCPAILEVEAPPRSQAFAKAVHIQCMDECALGSSTHDLEAAYIIPRTAHRCFERIRHKHLLDDAQYNIDHPSNGISLWVAVHKPWDRGRAALSPTRKIAIFSEGEFPITLLNHGALSPAAVTRREQQAAFDVLMKLRFTMSVLT